MHPLATVGCYTNYSYPSGDMRWDGMGRDEPRRNKRFPLPLLCFPLYCRHSYICSTVVALLTVVPVVEVK